MRSLQTLVQQWASESVRPLPPVSAAKVTGTLCRLQAVATPDLLYLYSLMGGMENMTNDFWRHWSMDEILAENREPSPFGVLFADYLIWSWCYRVQPKPDNTSAVYVEHFDGREPCLVASSLEGFFDAYLQDATKFFNGHAGAKSDA